MARKRQQAPGDLEHIRSFVNTADLEAGEDELGSAASLARWLSDRGFISDATRASSQDVISATRLREALRAVLLAHADGTPAPPDAWSEIDRAAERVDLRVRFATDRCGIEPQAGGVDRGLGRLLAIVHNAIADGTWERLKVCRDHTCQWAFYDHTKNRSGSWCTMEVCGNRAKARAYRERNRRPERSRRPGSPGVEHA